MYCAAISFGCIGTWLHLSSAVQLKHIEIQGFKSFADKTKLLFDKGITGIVGPNGCGKSNVVDAIRWVLGEQKTRNLRSEKMDNIIFNGTEKRKRANVVDVSITFENTKNILPTEFSSITITRRLYREGDSEYLLNNVPCRLKDIFTLLMDTGIGPDSYSIIELKMVDDMLADKNGARRLLFEEAAGVTRYKLRKKETLSRIEDTDQSLDRLADVMFEIDKSLKKLEKQAKRAEQYFELKEEYRRASLTVAYYKSESLLLETQTLQSTLQQGHDQQVEMEAQLAQFEAQLAHFNRQLTDAEQLTTSQQKILNQLIQQIAEQEAAKRVREERIKLLEQRAVSIQQEIHLGDTQMVQHQEQMTALEAQIDLANESYDTAEYQLGALENELTELAQALKHRKQQLDEIDGELKTKERALQALQKEADTRKVQAQGLQGQLTRIQSDAENHRQQAEAFQTEGGQVQAHIETIIHQQADYEAKQAIIEQSITQTKAQLQALHQQLNEDLRTQTALQKEYDLLKNLVDSLEGYPDSVVYLKQHSAEWQAIPLLSDLINIDSRYVVALENYLGAYLNYFVVETKAQAQYAIEKLKNEEKGRVQFWIAEELLNGISPAANNQVWTPTEVPAGCLSVLQMIEYPERYAPLMRSLFANVYLWTQDTYPDIVVPADVLLLDYLGVYLAGAYVWGGGSIGAFEGKRIGRVQNLGRLRQQLADLEQQIAAHQRTIATLEQQLQTLRADHPAQILQQLAKQRNQLEQQLSVSRAQQRTQMQSLQDLEKRQAELQAQLDRLQALQNQEEPQMNRLQDDLNDRYRMRSEHEREWNNRNQAHNKVQQALNQAQLQFVNAQNEIAAYKKDFRFCLENNLRITAQRERLSQELIAHQSQLSVLLNDTSSETEDRLERYQQKQALEAEVAAHEAQVQSLKHQMRQIDQAARDNRRLIGEQQARQQAAKEQIQALQHQRTTFIERAAIEWLTDAAGLSEWVTTHAPQAPASLGTLESKVNQLREKFNKFGEVNTTAIESYNEIKERYDFLDQQKQDLLAAKANLLTTIAEIDQTAQTQFMATFEQIRENFVRVFRALFSDQDQCDIVLLKPDDPLESPIDVLAQPKGKRPLSIHQLSGGEKTLTAISLLFAIYLIKPAPFCIFDEVDAPLDDANIDKFNTIIEEFSKESQFIVVTHNKRTMMRTHVMYGVTMEETGISRVLPVDWRTLQLN
jgi:chromosome segregation protein